MSIFPLLLDTSNKPTTCNTEEEKIHWYFTESFLCAYLQGKVCLTAFRLDLYCCFKGRDLGRLLLSRVSDISPMLIFAFISCNLVLR